jgi:hypothetical protein
MKKEPQPNAGARLFRTELLAHFAVVVRGSAVAIRASAAGHCGLLGALVGLLAAAFLMLSAAALTLCLGRLTRLAGVNLHAGHSVFVFALAAGQSLFVTCRGRLVLAARLAIFGVHHFRAAGTFCLPCALVGSDCLFLAAGCGLWRIGSLCHRNCGEAQNEKRSCQFHN